MRTHSSIALLLLFACNGLTACSPHTPSDSQVAKRRADELVPDTTDEQVMQSCFGDQPGAIQLGRDLLDRLESK
jgi:hypothetical protein